MRGLLEHYRYFTDKRFSTISGTLVYFLLMSIAPFLFWLTLLVGNVDLSGFAAHPFFSAVEPIISYFQTAASGAAGSAGLIFALTSLWSSTNFFYHLRRSGEIIYGTEKPKSGISLRLRSLLAVLASVIFVALAAAVPVVSVLVLQNIMPEVLAEVISVVFLTLFAFLVAYFLNSFACPYRLGFDGTIAGTLLTVILWLVFASGFTVYLGFANPQRLYGAIAAIIVFLLWSYLMVNSLVLGIIYNGRYAGVRHTLSLK